MRRYFFILFILNVYSGLAQEKAKPISFGMQETIHSAVLNEDRVLNIYLPPEYQDSAGKSYPVVYLLDGALDEDYFHVAGLMQFVNQWWVNYFPTAILVGISNTNRKRDFTQVAINDEEKKLNPYAGGADEFIRFIGEELQTYMKKNFRCNSQKTLIGQSLGGLLACDVLLHQPHMFQNYLIVSPSLWWNDGVLLKMNFQDLAEKFKTDTKVYLAVGKEGLAPVSTPHVMEVDAHLLYDKLLSMKAKHLTVNIDFLPAEDHATIGHEAFLRGLKYLGAH